VPRDSGSPGRCPPGAREPEKRRLRVVGLDEPLERRVEDHAEPEASTAPSIDARPAWCEASQQASAWPRSAFALCIRQSAAAVTGAALAG
jgi:hypothetical protein